MRYVVIEEKSYNDEGEIETWYIVRLKNPILHLLCFPSDYHPNRNKQDAFEEAYRLENHLQNKTISLKVVKQQ